MKDLSSAPPAEFKGVRFVLTDMDDTLTYHGRLAAATYSALEQLQCAGLKVMIVTAAPAGWCDQMARMWPVDGVIGENGGLFFRRDVTGHRLERQFWHGAEERLRVAEHLAEVGRDICATIPDATLAEDQPFRMTSVAITRPESESAKAAIIAALSRAGLSTTANNLWLMGWLGNYDKLAMVRRVLTEHFGTDAVVDQGSICYCGDSENDVPMFRHFTCSIGVGTVRHERLSVYPKWVTGGPGGAGFVEAAAKILTDRG